MDDDDIEVGVVVRPINPGRADLIGRVLGIHGDDVWILPLEDDPTLHSFVMARDALRAEWERYEEPDVTNWAQVSATYDILPPGQRVEIIVPEGRAGLSCSKHEALVLAAWILALLRPGREWNDIRDAVEIARPTELAQRRGATT